MSLTSRAKAPCLVKLSHVTYKRVLFHRWMSHVLYDWVTSRLNESYLTDEQFPCLVWKSHVLYDWVMSRMNESYFTYSMHARVMSCTTARVMSLIPCTPHINEFSCVHGIIICGVHGMYKTHLYVACMEYDSYSMHARVMSDCMHARVMSCTTESCFV